MVAVAEPSLEVVATVARNMVAQGGSETALAQGLSAERVATAPASRRHLHRPGGEILSERYVAGRRWVVMACAECGEPLAERQA